MNNVQTAVDLHGNELVIISRTEAKAVPNNGGFYFTGKPCKHGHISQRRISNGVCVECKRNIDKSGNADGREAADNQSLVNSIPMPVLDDSRISDLSRIEIDTCGLSPDKKLTKEEWQSLVLVAEKSKTFRCWMLGDLWNSCEWGDKATRMESLGVNAKSAREYGRVCTRIPHEMRRPNLSFTHHQNLCVQVVENEAQMVQLLDRVESRDMSAAQVTSMLRNLVGSRAEGDLAGGDENGADGTEGADVFNPFYGWGSLIKQAKDSISVYADEDLRKIEEIKVYLKSLLPSDAE